MKLYPSLFAYLNNCPPVPKSTLLHASARPIIVIDAKEDCSNQFLIPISDGVYEIAFPYLKPTEIQHENIQLEYIYNLSSICKKSYKLCVTDEVLDLETIKEENELPEWESKLGERLDNTVALLIRLFVGLFTNLFGYQKTSQSIILLTHLQEKLDNVNVDEANIPIVISLERRYQLRRKLDVLASKLRHQLKRQAEFISLGRIQEMDAYCLRDYIRRPGVTAAEKAGVKQELMAIQRYQDFNTAENKFLVYFSQILHLNCYQYERSHATQYKLEVQKFRLVITWFRQQPLVQGIQDRKYQFTKPNYVLQQNPIYRSFYQAYLEYIQKRYEKERIWLFRNQLVAEAVYICLTAALLSFTGRSIDTLSSIAGRTIPDKGRYIQVGTTVKVRIFLQNQVYVFGLSKPSQEVLSDWLLTWEIHKLDSPELEAQRFMLPIWVFWYCPNNEVIAQLHRYLQNQQSFKKGLVVYLQVPPKNASPISTVNNFSEDKLLLCQLPNPIAAQGFSQIVLFMAHLIKSAVESMV